MLLTIETAHVACSVALIDDGTVIGARHEEIGRGHAERLVSMIAEVLAKAGGAVPTEIVVDVGPGSFTGVRIGLAAARAFGFAWGCPVEGVGADALVARAAFARPGTPDRLLVALDAMRGEVFARAWTRSGPLGPVRAIPPENAATEACAIGAVAGSGVSLLGRTPGWVSAAGPNAATAIHLLAADRVAAAPLYIRAPDAKPAR